MPIAIMEGSNGDQQDVSMEWTSSPPGSPSRNGNTLKRKAEEDPRIGDSSAQDFQLSDPQDLVIDSKSKTTVETGKTQEDGKSRSAPAFIFDDLSLTLSTHRLPPVLDLTDLPSSPSSPSFPSNLAKRPKPGPSSSSRTTTTKSKKSAAGEGDEKKSKPKSDVKKGKGKSNPDIVKSGSE